MYYIYDIPRIICSRSVLCIIYIALVSSILLALLAVLCRLSLYSRLKIKLMHLLAMFKAYPLILSKYEYLY